MIVLQQIQVEWSLFKDCAAAIIALKINNSLEYIFLRKTPMQWESKFSTGAALAHHIRYRITLYFRTRTIAGLCWVHWSIFPFPERGAVMSSLDIALNVAEKLWLVMSEVRGEREPVLQLFPMGAVGCEDPSYESMGSVKPHRGPRCPH